MGPVCVMRVICADDTVKKGFLSFRVSLQIFLVGLRFTLDANANTTNNKALTLTDFTHLHDEFMKFMLSGC